MPGRLRTASSPFRTLMASASYRWAPLVFFAGAALMSVDCPLGGDLSVGRLPKYGDEGTRKEGPIIAKYDLFISYLCDHIRRLRRTRRKERLAPPRRGGTGPSQRARRSPPDRCPSSTSDR